MLMQVVYVYDDEGTMALAKITESQSAQDAAIDVVEAVVKWTKEFGFSMYSHGECCVHLQELEQLKLQVKNQDVDIHQTDWFCSVLGFTFSVQKPECDEVEWPTCKKYQEEEVLPDEQGHCSLCGSLMNNKGECLYQ
ncbi:hypothetical protein FCV44_03945 [Vibrio kanaloae]|uniref:Uncharacterized protein n=1 Tax=Vibrio sp. FF_307 TaxID=1652834 RepID=A0A0H4A338_9VIBR|nr:hypothetical protein [Vibrio kanaloae]AKN40644.1 hypothetical protein [Vibrio sp. FF_307]TKF00224.1 hypothetical protein FCV44_03945 [Vibrio kanaloae]TKF17849.1 hypothetical protein FCV47_07480 [Vibrio kanaloae]TKF78982.1 hypothetical protein FCV62_10710 [Vibrio kanaloae]